MNAADLFFIDTNVLLYSFDAADLSKQQAARNWTVALWERGTGRLSWQVMHEFYVNATRKIGVPPAIARDAVRSYAECLTSEISLDLIERAWELMDRARLGYWDALILASAEASGCQWLLSADFQAGRQYGSVRVINPFGTAPDGFFAE